MGSLLALAGGLTAGVLLQTRLSFGVFAWTALCVSVISAFYILRVRRTPTSIALVLFACALLLGAVRMDVARAPDHSFATQVGQRGTYQGVVVAEPTRTDTQQRVPVRIHAHGRSVTVLAEVPRFPTLVPGAQVSVSGVLVRPKPFATEGGRTFDYATYLRAQGIRYLLAYGAAHVTAPPAWYDWRALAARVHNAFVRGLRDALPDPYAALASGIVIGGKTGLGTRLTHAFVVAGLVQIIVLSGYNVMLVAEWTIALVSFLRAPARLRALAAGIVLIFFIAVAGFSATALRAAGMAVLALYARATGRQYTAGRALFATIFVMLLVNPFYVTGSPGFWLSVVATAGLIWLSPLLMQRLQWVPTLALRDAVATTVAAQIAVLPLLLYYTGNLSLVAFPANILVMPFMPATMAASAVAGVGGMLFGSGAPLFARALGLPAFLLTQGLFTVAQKAAALPLAAFVVPAFPFVVVVAGYAVLVAYVSFANRSSATAQLKLLKKAST